MSSGCMHEVLEGLLSCIGSLVWLQGHMLVSHWYLTLLQVWIFGHFPTRMSVSNKLFKLDEPQALQWLSRQNTIISIEYVKIFRTRLDALTLNEVHILILNIIAHH